MGLKNMSLILGFLGFVFLQGLLVCTAYNVHNYSFIVKNTFFERLCSNKTMLTVNGGFPGPTIHVRKGDRAYVNVHNEASYGVTIHWHGVKQPRNPWSDGPENITQCPIKPRKNFTYEVIFSDEEGTLWWHAHSDWTRATVHGEWFKGDVKEIIDNATATGGDPTLSDAYTINGQPGFPNNCSNDTSYKLTVEYGKTYLLRLVNAVMNEEMFFGIAKHNFTVVAHDGAYIKPVTTSYIMITPGQTMDILLTANQSPSHYYIAATPFFDSNAPFDSTNTSAILQYTGNYTLPSSIPYPTLPNVTDQDAADNFTTRIRSLASAEHPINVPKNITTQIFIAVSVNQILCANASCGGPNGNRLAASLNNVSFVTPSIDILQAYYRSLTGVFESDFPNQPPYAFNFTGDVGNNTLWKFQCYLSPSTYNLNDPPEVNTFGVPKNGWATIRFFANNPGNLSLSHKI
ncbi:laccase-14 [Quercus suber]|uniref:laccase n=2 Tax=Quercus suber TaxID=58331 RepID=A0AAW0L175_QUESU